MISLNISYRNDMNIKFVLFMLCVTALVFGAEAPAGADKTNACCVVPVSVAKDRCCDGLTTAPLSKHSIYQTEATFTTDTGHPFTLVELRGRPVVIDMFFASCGYACPLLVTDIQAIRAKLPAAMRDRTIFVLVSFDVARDTPAALAHYRAQRGLDDQWVLLHGDDDSIRELAALLGVKYKQDNDGGFSHSNLITVLNTQGEIVHQRTGLQGGLNEAAAAVIAKGSAVRD